MKTLQFCHSTRTDKQVHAVHKYACTPIHKHTHTNKQHTIHKLLQSKHQHWRGYSDNSECSAAYPRYCNGIE